MKLYEEGKSQKNIRVNSFAVDRSDFLEKVRVEVYESEEGVACVDFHSLIANLTKAYLERMGEEIIQEGKPHRVVELESSKRLADVNESALTPSMANLTLLKAGLKEWKQKAKSVDIDLGSEMEEEP